MKKMTEYCDTDKEKNNFKITGMFFMLESNLISIELLEAEHKKQMECFYEKVSDRDFNRCSLRNYNITVLLLKIISLELIFKIFYINEIQKENKTHKLNDIFECFNHNLQSKIIEEFRGSVERNRKCINLFKTKKLKIIDNFCMVMEVFTDFMKNYKYGEYADNFFVPLDSKFLNNLKKII